jgi:ferredoxin-NADP reductase
MIGFLDRFLDHTTMYRLVLYYLLGLLAAAFVLAFFGLVPHEPASIAFSAILITITCGVANRFFARAFGLPANAESVYITALILALIFDPVVATDLKGVGVLVFASVWAMASKYLLAAGGKHVFNPAALAAVLTGALLGAPASWWVAGNLALLPIVLVGGSLLVRKLRRFDLIAAFLAAVVVTTLLTTAPAQFGTVLIESVKSSPLLFFAFVMLTEPLTAPTGRLSRLIFAGLIGVLFTPSIHIGWFYFTPELALLVGNFLAFLASRDKRVALTLKAVEEVAQDTYDFVFSSPRALAFEAGQYLEWTLGVPRGDNRGNRRYFTVASAPTEPDIRLGVKFNPRASAFKQQLAAMSPGDTIVASQVAGHFTLPSNPKTKLAFLAGGIGITPFRSMLQYLIDRDEPRDITMLYGVESQDGIAYRDILDAAEHTLGIPTYYAVAMGAAPGQYAGFIDAQMVRETIPDYRDRVFYISGPQAMVQALRSMLIGIGVRRSRIKTDFFPGFA